jgi:hypothetical protein
MLPLLRVGSAHSFRSFLKFHNGCARPVVSFRAGPHLGFSYERAELAEQLVPLHRATPEHLDPFEPTQDTGRFVHRDNGSPQPVTCL